MDELVKRLSFFTYYVPHSVTHRDLPAKRRQVTYIKAEELSTGRDVLAELREHTFVHGGEAWAKLAHAAAMKRSRVVEEAVNGAFRAPEGRGGGKVCVFTGLRVDCEKIAAACEKATRAKPKKDGIPQPDVKVWWAHGGLSPQERDKIREEYMAHPGPCILVATGDSMGESVNLHDTDLAIIAMLPWTPGQIRQWEGRWVRLGMTRPVLILYLVAEGTKDEEVALALLNKLPAVEKVAKDEVLASLEQDLRGDEEAVANELLRKLTADDSAEDDDDEG
jgi:superfamily II DNA/RNA helicase